MQRGDALVHFHGPDQSFATLPQRAWLMEAPLEPALHSKRKHIVERSSELRCKASEADAILALGGCGHPAINPSADPALHCKLKRIM